MSGRQQRKLCDNALKLVYQRTSPSWKAAASTAVRELAQEFEYFTTEAVIYRLHMQGIHRRYRETEFEAVMQRAQRKGLIVETGDCRRAAGFEGQPDYLVVWASLIYMPPEIEDLKQAFEDAMTR